MRQIYIFSVVLLISFNGYSQDLADSSDLIRTEDRASLSLKLPKYNIGDIGFGGIIFYVDESGEHGLVCTFNDLSQDSKWGKRRKIKRNERLSEELNTATTIFGEKRRKDDFKRSDYANRLCEKFKSKFDNKTYEDWYLPTKEELNLLYLYKKEVDKVANENGGSPLESTYYWSSTEYNYDKSWVQYFSTGKQTVQFKDYPNNVRAIHAF